MKRQINNESKNTISVYFLLYNYHNTYIAGDTKMTQDNDFRIENILAEMGLSVDDVCVVLNELDHDNEVFQIVHQGTATDCLIFVGDNPDGCTHMTSKKDFISREPELLKSH